MDKDLNLRRAGSADRRRFFPGTLPGQYNPLTAIRRDFLGASGGKDTHLSAGVKRQVRESPAKQIKQSQILDQHCVYPQTGGASGRFQGAGKLPVGQENIQSQENPDAPNVAVCQGLSKFLLGEVLRTSPGVEAAPAQIYGIRPAFNGCLQGFWGTGGSQQFRVHLEFRLSSLC